MDPLPNLLPTRSLQCFEDQQVSYYVQGLWCDAVSSSRTSMLSVSSSRTCVLCWPR